MTEPETGVLLFFCGFIVGGCFVWIAWAQATIREYQRQLRKLDGED